MNNGYITISQYVETNDKDYLSLDSSLMLW